MKVIWDNLRVVPVLILLLIPLAFIRYQIYLVRSFRYPDVNVGVSRVKTVINGYNTSIVHSLEGVSVYSELDGTDVHLGMVCWFDSSNSHIEKLKESTYNSYLNSSGVFYKLDSKDLRCGWESDLLSRFYRYRYYFHLWVDSSIEKYMWEPYGGIFKGILFGSKANLSVKTKDMLIVSGLYHIIAASGYNLIFFENIIERTFSKYVSRDFRLISTIIILAGYVFIIGKEPSIIRAYIAYLLKVFHKVIGLRCMVWESIVYTILIFACIYPELLFTLGFQLSVSATIGISIVAQPYRLLIESRLKGNSKLGNVINEFVVSISVLLCVTPILLLNGLSSYYGGIVLGLLLLPILEGIMGEGLLVMIFSLFNIREVVLQFLSNIISLQIYTFLYVVDFFSIIGASYAFSVTGYIVLFILYFLPFLKLDPIRLNDLKYHR